MKIGPNLREVIDAKRMPLESVREALGWDQETLADILDDRQSPSISELLRLATFLGIGISRLLNGEEQSQQRAVKTAKEERVGVDHRGLLHYESLAPAFAGKHLEPFVVDLYKGECHEVEVSRHPGEEFIFVLTGELEVTVGEELFRLEEGDSLYFDSVLPHSLISVTPHSRMVAVIYKGESLFHSAKGHGMKSLIEAAKLLKPQNVVLVCPDHGSLGAVNRGIEEGVIQMVYLVGNSERIRSHCGSILLYPRRYAFVEVAGGGGDHETEAAKAGVALIRSGEAEMLMKGSINTATFIKGVLNRESGIGTGRRLSVVSVVELPGVDRLIFLTDGGINPELFPGDDPASGVDIIENAIDVARGLGVERPKVALLEANEIPSAKLPNTLLEQALSEREWPYADVSGPLSYDLAIYPEAVEKKGVTGNPVAGRADILVVPYISSGNFLYKSWVFTMGAEAANVVLGAKAPIILTSRSDSDLTKFLAICASALYGDFLRRSQKKAPGSAE